MHRVIQVTEDVYNRLKPKTNSLGGRDPRKVGFSEVIKQALDDQDRLKKRKIVKKMSINKNRDINHGKVNL